MPSCVNGAVRRSVEPSHPTQAPAVFFRMGAIAVTSPPGLVTQRGLEPPTRCTGRRLATATSRGLDLIRTSLHRPPTRVPRARNDSEQPDPDAHPKELRASAPCAPVI